ncbi:hypothetical protein HRTV-28_gp6 [Halorubrum tailed virus 28]|uniref:Uncharacterized protein n=1 Tax=Halorubrum tailed virus 28 TaxID=2878009 RepID=A0AAE8Y098_9CAUD|nr:hypothetical protein M1M39_gp07 [Halorubrum tailed virus 28]UBF23444.1 hypothetical protein HRTV-28_gp6 [Halorubrum tailed virus 28]
MSDHVKRGLTHHTDREVTTEWDGMDDGNVNAVVRCTECGKKIEMRYRRGMDAYVELSCPCGAHSIDVRIGGVVGLDIDVWEADTDVTY